MTPDQFHAIRCNAGLSLAQLSNMIRVHTRTIRRYEDGSLPVSGPVSVLMEMIDGGYIVTSKQIVERELQLLHENIPFKKA